VYPSSLGDVGARFDFSRERAGKENGHDVVETGLAMIVMDDVIYYVQKLLNSDVDSRFLFGFSSCSVLKSFSKIYKTSRH